jgi:hypothetical protein
MAAARAPWLDIVTVAFEIVGMVAVARWAWRQLGAARRDVLASVERHRHRRDAIARITAPRVVR